MTEVTQEPVPKEEPEVPKPDVTETTKGPETEAVTETTKKPEMEVVTETAEEPKPEAVTEEPKTETPKKKKPFFRGMFDKLKTKLQRKKTTAATQTPSTEASTSEQIKEAVPVSTSEQIKEAIPVSTAAAGITEAVQEAVEEVKEAITAPLVEEEPQSKEQEKQEAKTEEQEKPGDVSTGPKEYPVHEDQEQSST